MIWKIENRFLRALAAIALLPLMAVLIALLLLIELAEMMVEAFVMWVPRSWERVLYTEIHNVFRAIVGKDAK